jgi:hypothetical protein
MIGAPGGVDKLPKQSIQIKRSRFLPRRKLDKVLDLLSHDRLHFIHDESVRKHPIQVSVGVFVRALEWITPEMKHLRSP